MATPINDQLDEQIGKMLSSGSSAAQIIAHILRTGSNKYNIHNTQGVYAGADNEESLYFDYTRNNNGNPLSATRFAGVSTRRYDDPSIVGVGEKLYKNELFNAGEERYKSPYSGYYYSAATLAKTYQDAGSESQFYDVLSQYSAANVQAHLAKSNNPRLVHTAMNTVQFTRTEGTLMENFRNTAEILATSRGAMLNAELGGQENPFRKDKYNLSPLEAVDQVGKAKQEKLFLRNSQPQWGGLMPGQTTMDINGVPHIVSRIKLANSNELVGAGGGVIMAAEPFSKGTGHASRPIGTKDLAGFQFGGKGRSFSGENIDIGRVEDENGQVTRYLGESMGGAAETQIVGERIRVGSGRNVAQTITNYFESPEIAGILQQTKGAPTIQELRAKTGLGFSAPLLAWNGKGDQQAYESQLEARKAAKQDVLSWLTRTKNIQAEAHGLQGNYTFEAHNKPNIIAEVDLAMKMNAAPKGLASKPAPAIIDPSIGDRGLTSIYPTDVIKNPYVAGQQNMQVWRGYTSNYDVHKGYLNPAEREIAQRIMGSGLPFEQAYEREYNAIAATQTIFSAVPANEAMMPEPRTNSGRISGGDLLSMHMLGNPQMKRYVENVAKEGFSGESGSVLAALTNRADRTIQGPLGLTSDATLDDLARVLRENDVAEDQAVRIGEQVIPSLRAIGTQGPVAASVLAYAKAGSREEMLARGTELRATLERERMGPETLKDVTSVEATTAGGLLRYRNPEDPLFQGERGQENVYLGRRDVEAIAHQLSNNYGAQVTPGMVENYFGENEVFGEFSGFPRRGGAHVARYKLYEGEDYNSEYAGSSALWALEQFRDSDYDRALQQIGLKAMKDKSGKDTIVPVAGGRAAFYSQRPLEGRVLDSLSAATGPEAIYRQQRDLKDVLDRAPSVLETVLGIDQGEGRRVAPLRAVLPGSSRDQNVLAAFRQEAGISPEEAVMQILREKNPGEGVGPAKLAASYIEMETNRGQASIYGMTKTMQHAFATRVNYKDYVAAAKASNPYYEKAGIDPYAEAAMSFETPYQKAIDFEVVEPAIREAVSGNAGLFKSTGIREGNKGESAETVASTLMRAYMTTGMADWNALGAMLTPEGGDIAATAQRLQKYNQDRPLKDRGIDAETRQDPNYSTAPAVTMARMHLAMNFFRDENFYGAKDNPAYQAQRQTALQTLKEDPDSLEAMMAFRRSSMGEDFWPVAQPGGVIGMIEQGNLQAAGVSPGSKARAPNRQPVTTARPAGTKNMPVPEMYRLMRGENERGEQETQFVSASSAQNLIDDAYDSRLMGTLNMAFKGIGKLSFDNDALKRGREAETELEEYAKTHPEMAAKLGQRVPSADDMNARKLNRQYGYFESDGTPVKTSLLHDYLRWDKNNKKLYAIDQKTSSKGFSDDQLESYVLQQSSYAHSLTQLARKGKGEGAKYYLQNVAGFDEPTSSEIISTLRDQGIETIQPQIFGTKSSEPVESGQFYDLPMMSMAEVGRGLYKAVLARNQGVSEQAANALNLQWEFDEDGKQAHAVVKSYTGDTPLTLTPEAGYTTQSAVQKEQKRLSDYTEYTAAREAEIEPGEQKKPASTMAQEYLAEPSVGPQPQAGGGAGDGAKPPPIDTPAAPTSPGEPPESNGDTPQSVYREQGTINRMNRRSRSGSGRFKVGEADQASQLLSRLFTPEGLARPGLNPAREVAKFKGIGTDMDRYATEMYHAMSGDFSQSDLKGQRRLADQGRRANEPGWTDEARAITQAISENVHQGISEPSDAIIRGELGKNFSELMGQMYPGGSFGGMVGEADVMSKVGKSAAMTRVLNRLPAFAMGQIGDKGTLEGLLNSIKNVGRTTPLSDEVQKLLLGEQGDGTGGIANEINSMLQMSPDERKTTLQRKQREATGIASTGAQIEPVILGGKETEQSKNYREQLDRLTELMRENGDELKENIKSQKDFRSVVHDVVSGTKGLGKAIGEMEKLAGSGELEPDVASKIRAATRSARSILSSADASVQRFGTIGSYGAEKWGDKFAEETLTSAGDEEGGKRSVAASIANRMLSGYFAFQTLRALRYTFQPVTESGQQYMGSQMEAMGTLAQGGPAGTISQIPGYSGMVGLADMRYGFGQNANALMSGLYRAAGGIGTNLGAGPAGAAATIGLPAAGAAGITMAALGMGGLGAAALPVALGVGGLTALAGGISYLSGAQNDRMAAIRYGAQFPDTSGWQDTTGALAYNKLMGNVQSAKPLLEDARGPGPWAPSAAVTPTSGISASGVSGETTVTYGPKQSAAIGTVAGKPMSAEDIKTLAAINELKSNGPWDLDKLGSEAGLSALTDIIPSKLNSRFKLGMESSQKIANLVYTRTRSGQVPAEQLAELAAQGINVEDYMGMMDKLASYGGDMSIAGGLGLLSRKLTPQAARQELVYQGAVGGSWGEKNLTMAGVVSSSQLRTLAQQPDGGQMMGWLQQLGPQGQSMLNQMGMSPTGMAQSPVGQFMGSVLASGNPMAMTAAMQGGLLPIGGGGGGFMPMMDGSTGAGLFQRSMWGLTGTQMPTRQETYNWFGQQNSFWSGNQAMAGTTSMLAGRNPWAGIGEQTKQSIVSAAMGETFPGLGGAGGVQAYASQRQWEISSRLQGAGAALQAQGARLQHEFTINYAQPNEFMGIEMSYAQAKGGVVNTEWMQEHGIPAYNAGRGQIAWSRAQLAMEEENQAAQSSQQRTRLGWQMQDLMKNWSQFRTQTGWQREDFATQGERMQYNRGYQQWQFQFQAQDMALQRQYSAEDYAYGKQVRQLQYGWQMEDYDEGIRRSTGYQRKQLVKQRDRATEMQNIEEGQEDRVRKRQEEAEKRQEEAFKKQIEHWKQTLRFEDEDFKKQRERFEEQTKWREEDFSNQRSRLQQEMEWAEEAAARAKKSLEIRKEQIDAEESQMETVHAAKLVMFDAEKVLEEEKFKLSQIIIGMTKKEQDEMRALDLIIQGMRDEEAKRVEELNKLEYDFFVMMVNLLKTGKDWVGALPHQLDENSNEEDPRYQEQTKAAGGYGRKGNLVGENGMEILGSNGYVWPTKYLTPKATDLSDQTITIEAKQPIEINGQKITDALMTFIIPAVALQGRRSLRR